MTNSSFTRIDIKAWPLLVFVVTLALGGCTAQQTPPFHLQEATIQSIQAAITSGQTSCRAIVQAYIDRAKAYNGVCTKLVTADGAPVPASTGVVRAGAPLVFPTETV